MRKKELISLSFAQDIGLVPKIMTKGLEVDCYEGRYLFEGREGMKERQERGERIYKQRRKEIINTFCCNKDLELCEFPVEEIKNACKKLKGGKKNEIKC